MKYYCVEYGWTFDSDRLAWILKGCGLTIIRIEKEIINNIKYGRREPHLA